MIHEIIVTNPRGEQLPLTLMRPDTSGLILVNVNGLGPAKSNINLRDKVAISGSTFNTANTPSRNIVFTLQFMETTEVDSDISSIENSRLRTYRYFPNESRIRLDVITDVGMFYIYGYVESNEPTIFSAQSGCVISIICPDPFFKSIEADADIPVSPYEKTFEFPDSFLLSEFTVGEKILDQPPFTIAYDGTMTTGPTIKIEADGGTVLNPIISFVDKNDPNIIRHLGFNISILDNEYLTVVCERQNISVTRYSDGALINEIGTVSLDSTWPTLLPGDNNFTYDAESGMEYIRLSYTYSRMYIGV